jgi:hypothetical protein
MPAILLLRDAAGRTVGDDIAMGEDKTLLGELTTGLP